MTRMLRFLLLLGLSVSAANAQPKPFEGRSGSFAARLIMVDDVDAFWRAWRGPQPPTVRETNVVTPFKPAHALLVFTGCKAGADGKCNVGIAFSVIGPDKRPYGRPNSGTAYNGVAPPGGRLAASGARLTLKLESNDKPGPYLVTAVVTDRIAGASVTLRRGVIAGVPRKRTA